MTQTAAIVTTLKQPGPSLASFLKYHSAIGFSRIFLFFDDRRLLFFVYFFRVGKQGKEADNKRHQQQS